MESSRKSLLSRLGDALKTTTVPASIWACLRVSDLNALERLVDEACGAPKLALLVLRNCYAIPRLWMEISLYDEKYTPSATSSASSNHSSSDGRIALAMAEKNKAIKRDHETCVITQIPPIDVFHIYPHSLRSENRTGGLRAAVSPFWSLLHLFFDEDQLDTWHREIFPDPISPDRGAEGCANLICLTPQVRTYLRMGKCAFRPVRQNLERTELEVEFHWLPKHPHGPLDSVPLEQQPLSTEGLTDSGGSIMTMSDFSPLYSGQRFTLRTEDPVALPLPSFALLEMQWKLNQIVSLSAAAEGSDIDEEPDDCRSSYVPGLDRRGIENWASKVSDDADVGSVHPEKPSG